jgi:predicted metal-dependent phosphoesterase TrpH
MIVKENRMRVDMHMHTTASDGTWSPLELVNHIKETGIKIFSVTDHDSVENIPAVTELVKDTGIRFIRGTEVNACFENKNLHILGYGIDIGSDSFSEVIKANKSFLSAFDENRIRLLASHGYPVSPDEYRIYDYSRERGGWKTLNYCIDKGLCKNHRELFGLYDAIAAFFDPSGFAALHDVTAAIREAGGVPVLAHPGARIYEFDYRTLIDRIVDEGVEGIECFHTENETVVTRYCLEYCRSNGLRITGGSDCHGNFAVDRFLGKPEIYLEQLDLGSLV